MQSTKLGKYEIWYENSDEFYELKKEIFSENCYYIELEKEDPVIVDAGAHIGMATLYYKMLFPESRIIAFEPVPYNFNILEKNIHENQLENVELFQAVVAPKSGVLRIQEPIGEGAWRSGAGIIPKGWKGIQDNQEIKVEAIGIQEILHDKIDIFKMDIEGMEYEVIRNAGSLLRNVKNWVIEVHPRKDHRIEEIQKILLQNGFKIEVSKDKSSLGEGLTVISAVLK
ncbi:FkbM family methyltransferase [Candidatus Woesebacteria bacterium]|nr:FkbM family methyltransferase [Candidatus Woesebacteria bacterium]